MKQFVRTFPAPENLVEICNKSNNAHLPLSIIGNAKFVGHNFSEFDNIFMFVELSQNFNFSDCGDWKAFALLVQPYFLQSHNFVGAFVTCFENLTKSPLAYNITELIIFDKLTPPIIIRAVVFVSS